MDTIYEELYVIWELMFPTSILGEYQGIFELANVMITIVVVFGLILLPLWRVASFMVRGGRK